MSHQRPHQTMNKHPAQHWERLPMNIQGLIILQKKLNKPCWKKNHCFLLPSASRPSGAQKSFAFSSLLGFQPESRLAGNLPGRQGRPALSPRGLVPLSQRCISESPRLGWAGPLRGLELKRMREVVHAGPGNTFGKESAQP